MLLIIFIIIAIIFKTKENNISLVCSETSSVISQNANYTFTIIRNTDSNGNSITPSTLASNSVLTIFLPSFNLTMSVCQNNLNCAFNSTAITITNLFVVNQSQTVLTIIVTGIINPFQSNTQYTVSCVISTNGQSIDTAQVQIQFIPSTFAGYTLNFLPGNVSYNSNLSIALIPSITISNGAKLNITLPKYYTYSAKNLSINVPSTLVCSYTCTMSLVINSIIITVSNITVQANSNLTILLNGVVSSPTTQPADSVYIVSFDSNGNQYDTVYAPIGSSVPNYFTLNNLTNGVVNTPFTLSFNFYTTNVFATNDTIIFTLPWQISLKSTSALQLISSSVSTYNVAYILPNIVQISNITTFSSSYNPVNMTFNLTNINGPNNTAFIFGVLVQIFRNGYIYNYGESGFSASTGQLVLTNTPSTTIAGAISSYNISLQITNTIPVSGSIVIKFPSSVILKSCSANSTIIACSVPSSNLIFLNFTNSYSASNFNFTANAINPVTSQGLTITACSVDASYYNLDCGILTFFTVISTTLPSSLISLTQSSFYVYDIASYTFTITLTNYTIVNGYGIITLPTVLNFVNSTSFNCLINSNPFCILKSSNSPIAISFPINASITIYTIVVGNIRNPSSTTPFQFQVTITDANNNIYYNIVSGYYSMFYPYLLTNTTYTTNNCTNTAKANYTVTFSIPFNITSGIVRVYLNSNSTSIYTLNYSNPIILVNYTTTATLQPYSLFFNIGTSDSLYLIFNTTLIITNCLPSYISVSGSISGLPYQTGEVLVSLITPGNSIIVTLPNQYTVNNNSKNIGCMGLSNLSCIISSINTLQVNPIGNTTNIIFQISNLTNPYSSSYFTFYIYYNNYLMSYNNNTLSYSAPCTLPCKSCFSGNISTCTSCYNSTYSIYVFYDSINNNCLSQCHYNQYQSNYSCILCPVQCVNCSNATTCYSCISGYYILNNTCLTTCPVYFYPNNAFCTLCVYPCSTCVNNVTCILCVTNYSYLNGSCLSQCPNTTVSLSGSCIACSVNCLTCQTNASLCTSCTTGNYLFNGTKCVASCPDGYINSNNGICQACSSSCLTCLINTTTCISCQNSYLFNNSCIASCPYSYYSSGTQCLNCPMQCLQCTSVSNCQICATNYSLFNNTYCVSTCPTGTASIKQNCTACATGCYSCSSISSCDTCIATYYMYNNNCYQSCPSNTYLNYNNTCVNCPIACTSCNQLCLSCVTGYYLYQGNCTSLCPNNTIASNQICIACSIVYPNCASCSITSCLSCSIPFSYYNFSCYQNCPVGISINYTCHSCIQGCISCNVSVSNCTSCASNYLFFNYSCLLSCPSPYISNNITCVSCPIQCSTCYNLTYCLSCSADYLFLNNFCVSECPSSYFTNNNFCVACLIGCLYCNSTTCFTCNNGYIFGNGVCYTTCPTNLPYQINNTCNKCRLNCLQCSIKQCQACNNSLYTYGSECVTTCPNGTIIQNFTCIDNSTQTIQTTFGNQSIVPFPFTIALVIFIMMVLMSKVQHIHTYIFGCFSSFSSLMVIFSWITFICILYTSNYIQMSFYLILAALFIQLVLNIIYFIFSHKIQIHDQKFTQWKDRKLKNRIAYIVTTSLFLFNFRVHMILFSKLFNLEMFKAYYDAIKKFFFFNVMMILSLLLANTLSLISAGFIVSNQSISRNNIFYLGIDLIIVTTLDILFSLLIIKKDKNFFEYKEPLTSKDQESTVKIQKTEISHHIQEQQQIDNIFDQHHLQQHEVNNSNQEILNIFQSERNQLKDNNGIGQNDKSVLSLPVGHNKVLNVDQKDRDKKREVFTEKNINNNRDGTDQQFFFEKDGAGDNMVMAKNTRRERKSKKTHSIDNQQEGIEALRKEDDLQTSHKQTQHNEEPHDNNLEQKHNNSMTQAKEQEEVIQPEEQVKEQQSELPKQEPKQEGAEEGLAIEKYINLELTSSQMKKPENLNDIFSYGHLNKDKDAIEIITKESNQQNVNQTKSPKATTSPLSNDRKFYQHSPLKRLFSNLKPFDDQQQSNNPNNNNNNPSPTSSSNSKTKKSRILQNNSKLNNESSNSPKNSSPKSKNKQSSLIKSKDIPKQELQKSRVYFEHIEKKINQDIAQSNILEPLNYAQQLSLSNNQHKYFKQSPYQQYQLSNQNDNQNSHQQQQQRQQKSNLVTFNQEEDQQQIKRDSQEVNEERQEKKQQQRLQQMNKLDKEEIQINKQSITLNNNNNNEQKNSLSLVTLLEQQKDGRRGSTVTPPKTFFLNRRIRKNRNRKNSPEQQEDKQRNHQQALTLSPKYHNKPFTSKIRKIHYEKLQKQQQQQHQQTYLNQSPRVYPFKFKKSKQSFDYPNQQQFHSNMEFVEHETRDQPYDEYTPKEADIQNQRTFTRIRYKQDGQIPPIQFMKNLKNYKYQNEASEYSSTLNHQQSSRQYPPLRPTTTTQKRPSQLFFTNRVYNLPVYDQSSMHQTNNVNERMLEKICFSNQKQKKKKTLEAVYLKTLPHHNNHK